MLKGKIRQFVLLRKTLLPVHYDNLCSPAMHRLGLVPFISFRRPDLVSKNERQTRPIFIMDDNVVKGLDYSFADFI